MTNKKITAWLREHRDLWEGKEPTKALYKELFGKMRDAGVVAKTTYWADVTIGGHIQEIKKEG
jgi:hypothetical protein